MYVLGPFRARITVFVGGNSFTAGGCQISVGATSSDGCLNEQVARVVVSMKTGPNSANLPEQIDHHR